MHRWQNYVKEIDINIPDLGDTAVNRLGRTGGISINFSAGLLIFATISAKCYFPAYL